MKTYQFLYAVALIATAQLYAQARSYRFVSDRPVKVTINQTESMGGEAKPSLSFDVIPSRPYNTSTNYFVQSITITDAPNKSYTWYSRMTGKGENVSEDDRRYYGFDQKLNRGGTYRIVGANDESKFTSEDTL